MGTRNVTKVIKDGKTVVSQYGQWDGYPTHTGHNVLEFVKKHDMDVFAEQLDKVKRSELTDDELIQKFDEICNKVKEKLHKDYFTTDDIKSAKRMAGCISNDEYVFYMASVRDTGCEILELIMDNDNVEVTLFNDENEDMLFGIEGVYTVDMDAEKVICWYHDIEREYTFREVKEMKDIEAEMKDMENADDE